MRSRMPADSSAEPSRRSISSAVSLSVSGSSSTVVAFELAAAPRRPKLEQVRPRDAEDEQRRIARPVGDVLDQVEERRLGPLEVVEVDDERTLAGGRLEEPPHRERDVLGGGVAVAEQRRDRCVRRQARRASSCFTASTTGQ